MYVGDIETDGLLHELTKLHCAVFKKYKKGKWFIACDPLRLKQSTKEKLDSDYNITWIKPEALSETMATFGTLVGHNFFGFDFEALKKLDYIESYDMYPEWNIDGNPVKLVDSLSMSRCLYPDRPVPAGMPTKVKNPITGEMKTVGAHGLEAWGWRVANAKPEITDWLNLELEEYLHRCMEDVIINELTLDRLLKEAKQSAVGGDWSEALDTNQRADFLMCQQEFDGILFDKEKALRLLDRIDGMMQEIEEDVEPKLPRKMIAKSKQPNFPKKPFSDEGEITHAGFNWLRKLGFELNEEYFDKPKYPAKPFKANGDLSANGQKFMEENELQTKEEVREKIAYCESLKPFKSVVQEQDGIKALEFKHMPDLTEPMLMSNQDDIKKYLVADLGWEPTLWRTKDVTRDDNKQQREEQDIKERIDKYIEDVLESPYRKFIEKDLGIKFNAPKAMLMRHLNKKARYLPTSPQLKDERKELCPNLEKLEGDMARQIVKWLSLRNRRTVLKALDEKKSTGWLNNPRLERDGRIGQGFSGVTNTNRYKHREVVNLPQASPDVLLGYEMRDLFISPEDKVNLGGDGSNLEGFVAACYAWKHDDGVYARSLSGDPHTTNAEAYSKAAGRIISRGEGKNYTYGILYGCQKAKLAAMAGISQDKAQKVIDAFWDTNWGLKKLRDSLEKYWESTGKKYIRAIDGRKIYTRSKHSLVNALFQSCGSIMMFKAGNLLYNKIREEGIEGAVRLAFVHDEYQYEIPRDQIKAKSFLTKEEAQDYNDGKLWSNVKEINGKFWIFYSRVGELLDQSLTEAGESFNMPMEFRAAYDLGSSLAETH